MYREFLYLDADLIQSVIAQLKEGLLTQIVEGKEQSLEGRARLAAGVLSHLLPIGVEGSASRSSNLQSSKVLHDYACSIALEALNENDMLVELDENAPDSLSLPDNAFVLVRGNIDIIDYDIVREFAKHEDFINSLSQNTQASGDTGDEQTVSPATAGRNRAQRRAMARQQQPQTRPPSTSPSPSALQNIRQFLDSFMGDLLVVRAVLSNGLTFTGPLVRTSLREEIRHYIFKRGGAPQEGWAMLGQISAIPNATSKLGTLTAAVSGLATESETLSHSADTASDMLNLVVEPLYKLQEAIASVSYPDVAVTPFAIYRELGAVR